MKLFLFFAIIFLSLLGGATMPRTISALVQSPSPGPRTAAALVYDEQRQQVVLLGGYLWSSPRQQLERTELLAWDGQAWQRIPGSELRARTLSAAVYDAQRQRLVSFWGSGTNKEQRWEWDGKNWQPLSDERPDERFHAAMVYDTKRSKIVMYGGTIAQQTSSGAPGRWGYPTDTWEATGRQWTQRAQQGPVGRALTCGALVYDSQRRQTLLFGGLGEAANQGQPQPVYNDTWIWNGRSWRQFQGASPPPRFAHSLAFDRRAGIVLLYGGSNGKEQFGDMWQWDGRRWTEIKMTSPTPGKRSGHAMAYDAARNKTVLYGGTGATVLEDTWEWNDKHWIQIK